MSKPIHLREADFKREIDKFTYPQKMKDEFFDYWSEPDRAPKPKMRFEKEKTWHLPRRLSRWANNGYQKEKIIVENKRNLIPDDSEIGKLDQFLDKYSKPGGADIPFDDFGQWFELMRDNKLLIKMGQREIDELLDEYNGNKFKCRCWVVRKTLEMYINSGMTIKNIIDLRKRLK